MINCTSCGTLFEKPMVGRKCKPCMNKKQRELRKLKNNEITKRYEKTKKGYLVRTYRNMLNRILGILKSKQHIYKGLEILSKEQFYNFSLNDESYNLLFENYQKNNYCLKFAPSIDRIDSDKGYLLDNIRWISFSENSSLGASSHKRRNN